MVLLQGSGQQKYMVHKFATKVRYGDPDMAQFGLKAQPAARAARCAARYAAALASRLGLLRPEA